MHLASMNIREVACKNLDEIRHEHRGYWLGKEDTPLGPAGGSGNSHDTGDDDRSGQDRTRPGGGGAGGGAGDEAAGGDIGKRKRQQDFILHVAFADSLA